MLNDNINLEFKRSGNTIYIKNKGLQLNIIPGCVFETKGITYLNTKTKIINLIIDEKIKKHSEIKDMIEKIYNEISEHIREEDRFDPDKIINPLKKNSDSTYTLQLFITDWNGENITLFYDNNNKLINTEILEDKTFSIYPAISVEKISLNTNTNIAYVNMILKEGIVNNIKNKRLLDFEEYKIYINNENIN
jgi:hypothetical protein